MRGDANSHQICLEVAAASDALITPTADTGRPPGTPQLELSEQSDVAIFVFTDGESNRLGRASVMHTPNGWVVEWTERCI